MKRMPIWLSIALILITLAGIWWRMDVFAHRGWTTDEFNQYKTGLGELKPFWTRVFYCEAHSFPGDYVLTYPFIQLFKPNQHWGIVIPHVISAVLCFYVLWLICRRYFKTPAAWLITFGLFACHRELIFHALELRPYSVLTLTGLSTFYILDCLIDPKLKHSSTKLCAWWIILILTIVYHPYGMYMCLCYSLFLLLRDWRKPDVLTTIRHRWLFWSSLIVLSIPLWIYYIQGNPLNAPQMLKVHQIDVFEYIPNPMVHPIGFLKSTAGNLLGSKIAYILSIGLLLRLFWPQKGRLEIWGFFGIIIIIPLLLLLGADAHFEYWFLQRQYIWVMAIYPFFVGQCWEEILIDGKKQ